MAGFTAHMSRLMQNRRAKIDNKGQELFFTQAGGILGALALGIAAFTMPATFPVIAPYMLLTGAALGAVVMVSLPERNLNGDPLPKPLGQKITDTFIGGFIGAIGATILPGLPMMAIGGAIGTGLGKLAGSAIDYALGTTAMAAKAAAKAKENASLDAPVTRRALRPDCGNDFAVNNLSSRFNDTPAQATTADSSAQPQARKTATRRPQERH